MLRKSVQWIAAALAIAALLTSLLYVRAMKGARQRISDKSTIISSPFGDIEYTEHGSGPPVLVIHGSGGGYDQGQLVAKAILGKNFRIITPSRFGYLRSTYHEGATFDEQAHAYAFLLDELGIDQVAVVALSHGGPSALLLAALHPERVSSLTLLSAGVASSQDENQADANRKGDMLTTIFKYDPLYWAATKVFRSQLLTLMGVDKTTIATLTAEQRTLVGQVIDYMNPVSPRSAGVALDNSAAMPNERITAIQAPTLIVHATNDALQLYHNAEYAAANIPNASLLSFERGGHFLLIVEQASIRAATQKHILAYSR